MEKELVFKMEDRGDRKITYKFLVYGLEDYYLSLITLRFGSFLFYEALKKGLSDESYNPSFTLLHGHPSKVMSEEERHKNTITYTLQTSIIGSHFNHQIEKVGSTKYAIDNLRVTNAHYTRTKFINSLYEILEKYLEAFAVHSGEGETQTRKCSLRIALRKQPWYIMLYFLRNNASHENNLFKKIEFKAFLKELPSPFVWREIVVTNGMDGHTLRYNDLDIEELYKEIMTFIANNHLLFISKTDGTIISELDNGLLAHLEEQKKGAV